MISEIYPIEKCQKVNLPQGAIYLGPSNKEQSVGYLELNPQTSLTLHNRPALEKLTQVKGKSSMVVYDQGDGQIVTMLEGDKYTIEPAQTYHTHVNPFDEVCLQYWDFEGDITAIIEAIISQGD